MSEIPPEKPSAPLCTRRKMYIYIGFGENIHSFTKPGRSPGFCFFSSLFYAAFLPLPSFSRISGPALCGVFCVGRGGVFGFWRQSGTFPPFFTVSFRREIPIRFPGVPDGVFTPDPSRKRVFCPPKNGSFCHRKHVLQTRKRKCPAQQNARNHK